jgi:hypothetical protein
MTRQKDILNEQINDLERRRDKLHVELSRVDAQLEAYRSLREKFAQADDGPAASKVENGVSFNYSSMGPTESILHYLIHNPGSKIADVVRAVAPTVKTNADDRERMIYSIIYQLTNKNKIVRDGKRLRLPG